MRPPPVEFAWVFYDGTCGLCHRAVRFAAARDRDGSLFRFAPLGGKTAVRELGKDRSGFSPADSVLVLTPAGEVKIRSDAVIYILRRLGRGWKILGEILSIVPAPLLDPLYRLVAALRRRIYPPPAGPCPVVAEELRARFEP